MPRILIVEDNETLADLIGQYLQRKGLEVHISADGGSGLRAFETGTYDLLLVDVKLPIMSGDEVCRQVRSSERGKELPLIMMSAFVKDEAWIGRLKQELRLSGFLIKPFPSETLFSLIMDTLRAPRTEEAPAASSAAAAKLPPSIKGDISRTPFAQVLLYLWTKRATGILLAKQDALAWTFFFVGGAPVECEVPKGPDDFGNYLAHRNLTTSSELEIYEDLRKRTDADPVDLFVKMGALTTEEFASERGAYLRDRLIDCFSWSNGSVLFEWRRSFLPSAPAASAFLPAVFYRGFKAHLPQFRMAAFVEEKGGLYVERTPEFYEYQNHLAEELPSAEVLDLVNGVSTCSGIVSAFDSDDTAILLYTLDYLKAVSYSSTPKRSSAEPPFPLRERKPKKPKREAETFEDLGSELAEEIESIENIENLGMQQQDATDTDVQTALEDDLRQQWDAIREKNYYEIFGMTQNSFSFDKLKESYFELTRTYGPEKFFGSSGEVMELAQEFLSRVSNAYTTLSNVVSKENYDALLGQQVPTDAEEKKFYEQVQFQSGKVLIEKGQYESAEKTFTTCLTLTPDKPEYQVYLAVAIYHNPANRENPAAIKRAKELVNKSLLWEKLPIAYALKGTMLYDENMLNLAEAEFKKALRMNQNNKTALKYLEMIRKKREEEEKKGGIFQKLFK
jgi:CheY-like chemotaxis protein/curved DNA-binding protein CbpA